MCAPVEERVLDPMACAFVAVEQVVSNQSEGAVIVRFMDEPVRAGHRLGQRSRHVPASVIVHANEIQRVVRCVHRRLVVVGPHASPRSHCDCRTGWGGRKDRDK